MVLLSKVEGAFGELTGRTNDDRGGAWVIRDLVCSAEEFKIQN